MFVNNMYLAVSNLWYEIVDLECARMWQGLLVVGLNLRGSRDTIPHTAVGRPPRRGPAGLAGGPRGAPTLAASAQCYKSPMAWPR